MTARAATLDRPPDAAAGKPERGPLRFQYASGARPVEGFVIKRGIGRGGFGEVYFATSGAGKEVALKHIERNLEVELRGVGQCLNLKHPNLIDLYDIRYDDMGDAWVVMEYVGGPSLKETIDRNPNGLPHDQVNYWFRGIAAGVAYLHNHGIVHRDLKPGNIFQDNSFVKIGDYGLSKFISTSRRSGQTESVGTFHYMAPEIGKGVYGKEIDIYALGILLFEMITGRTPFDGESSQEIIMKHLTDDPDLSSVPQPYRTIIERALQKDPAKRFHSAGEMLATLASAAASPAMKNSSAAANEPPLYIGDDLEGIEFGPLVEHPELALAASAAQPLPPVRALPRRQPLLPLAQPLPVGQVALWQNAPGTPLKVALLIGAAVVAALQGAWLLSCAALLGCFYVIYLGFRAAALPVTLGRTLLTRAPVAGAPLAVAAVPAATISRATWQQVGRRLLREKTATDQVAELTASLLVAAAISAVLTLGMAIIASESKSQSASELALPLWLWLMTTAGSWMALLIGKWSERGSRPAALRWLAALGLGLAFGGLAYATSQHLLISFGGASPRGAPFAFWSRDMFDAAGTPKLPVFLAYFGAVLGSIGWAKLCDPLRSWRMRLSPVLFSILVAWLWQLVFPFPQPWGFLLVASVVIATQLAAPRVSAARLRAAAEQGLA